MWMAPDPTSKQGRSIAHSNRRLNIWEGAVRSSKTVGANLKWLKQVAYYVKMGVPGDLLMVGKTERTLRRNVLDPFGEFLRAHWRYNKGEAEGYLWGRKIHVVGANDERAEGKIRGGTYLAAYLDEGTLLPESFFKMLLSRLSLPSARLFVTTNPDSPYHWLKTEYLDRADELDLWTDKFLLEDNPHLDPQYVRELKKEYTGLWYRRFILGQWVQAAGAVYDMWNEEKHMVKLPDEKRRRITRYVIDCDYGTSNPTTFSIKGIWFEDGVAHAHTFMESYYDGRVKGQRTDEEHADELARFVPDKIKKAKPVVYVDPSAASFKVVLAKRKWNVKDADNDVINGIRFVSAMLGDDEPRYTVDPSCKETGKAYAAYIWDEKAQKRGEDKPLKENDHPCDRDRYGLYTHLGGEQRTKGARLVTL